MSGSEIRFNILASTVESADAWLDLAVKAEDLGYAAFYAPDHVGLTASPFSALAAAAAVTTTLQLGTYVLNCGVRSPLDIASDAATLDRLSSGRAVLGLGAGHTPNEWTMSGLAYPSPAQRVDRLVEMVDVVTALLRGDVVTHHGPSFALHEASLQDPLPVQEQIPLLIGGNGKRVLALAGRVADTVGLSGLGRTLEDGHRHEVDWSTESIDLRVAHLQAAEVAAKRAPSREALVQYVEITDDRDAVAEKVSGLAPGLDAASVLSAPYMLVGTVDQVVEEMAQHRERWGITSYVVRADAIDAVAPIIERLRSEDI